ncbi:TonB-dependent receptor [Alloacidobacterium dinghuense]|uniref:TonB-dependent receptor n=1 Tax=Alloacidobacterium dinghuense TaxID=2763107 RepID=A0A7G8BIV1_9BACT|nr:TonB-dependent receptor [Alloacidobacterium dinghuense]QNI32471.1 TonB-dependent receptor [Alloacidobacterium dinghuense]
MRTLGRAILLCAFVFLSSTILTHVFAQSNSGSVSGTVTDATGAVVPGASVTIENPVSGYSRSTTTDNTGRFQFTNVPFNPYHLTTSKQGFDTSAQDVDVSSVVPVTANINLKVGEAAVTTVVVTGEDLVENDTTMHTDIDRGLFQKLPLESQSSSVSSLVTLASPGVAADSNGLFHGMGDHASNSFSVDGQPITDQQSKVFSNQIPADSVQSLEVIDGAPPAEYGDKTSLVIKVTTRSGQGLKKPTGSINTSYGTFGSVTGGFDLGYGGDNWGNFISADGLNTSRFLDPPEFKVFHAKGNEENIFDRVDYNLTQADSLHLNLNYTRSWFQTPNAYDNLNVFDQFGNSLGETDQKSKIETYNIAPTYTRLISNSSVFNFGGYVRKDAYNYYPSGNLLADLGPIQSESIKQQRSLLNTGAHTDISYVKGIHNAKVGAVYEQTFLREHNSLGIVNPDTNAPCLDINGNPLNGFTDPSQCAAAGDTPNPNFNPTLLPYDLTRGGSNYLFFGHTDVKELSMYAEDQIKTGNWLFNVGIRGDLYNGLVRERQAEPRLGIAYSIKPSNTVLRVSYARTLETPFNENLVLSSTGCGDPVLSPILLCTPGVSGRLNPGFRNEFHAGFQQAFGKYAVISGEYIWKYTHNAFDFSILGNTPIFFPIDWHNSKIPGFTLRADVPNFHNISAFVVMSSVAARFFPPQIAGAGATVGQSGFPFRIDHDERYNETTHIQYQMPFRKSTWYSFNWRYDSGLVAGNAPCYGLTDPNSPCLLSSTQLNGQPAIKLVNAFGAPLTGDQEFQAGFACNGVKATPYSPLPGVCLASQFSSSLISIPAPGTGNNDTNPQRIQPRSLFDMAMGDDNIFSGDRYRWGARVTAVNVTNKYALYNFLSTFSGTHYVTPRAITGQISFSF